MDAHCFKQPRFVYAKAVRDTAQVEMRSADERKIEAARHVAASKNATVAGRVEMPNCSLRGWSDPRGDG